jgi:glycosyltransferase involved in cell wall biosynthesis
MNKISIITVNYNDKIGLKKTIESVVKQTFVDYEFIIIDGGSTDGSREIIEEYADRISYWVSEPDKGIYNAMNKGIRSATGYFVLFLNSGDIFYDNKVLSEIDSLIGIDFDIYYGDIIVKKQNSQRLKKYPDELSFSYFYTNALCHQSCFIKRELFYEHFFYNEDYKIYSDGEFFMYTICCKNVPYKHIDLTISIYDFTGISSNPKFEKLHQEEKFKSINKFFPLFAVDYKVLSKLNSKRIRQLLHIQKYPFAWKIVKALVNIIMIFIPKLNK